MAPYGLFLVAGLALGSGPGSGSASGVGAGLGALTGWSVLPVPLTTAGLTARFAPFVGLDYVLGW